MKKINFSELSKPQKALVYLVLGILISGLVWGVSTTLPDAVDWRTAFRPAALKLLSGHSPYEVEGFFNPFWALIPLIPMAVFPEAVGRGILFVASIIALAWTARKLGGSAWAVLLLLISPPAMHGLLNGNIDWLALIGLALPPWIGLFFVTIKPQIGFAVAIFWAVEAWRNGGWKGLLRFAGPFAVVLLASLLLFGMWPLRSAKEVGLWWNASLWPASIPVGLALLVAALRKRNINYAMGASPCLSPYILLHSWIIALMAIIRSTPELAVSVAGLWVLVILRGMGS